MDNLLTVPLTARHMQGHRHLNSNISTAEGLLCMLHPGWARMRHITILEAAGFLEAILPLRPNLIRNIPHLRDTECSIRATLLLLQYRGTLPKGTCNLLCSKDIMGIRPLRQWARTLALWEVIKLEDTLKDIMTRRTSTKRRKRYGAN